MPIREAVHTEEGKPLASTKPQLPEALWVEVYNEFYVLETTHGCLVKVGDNITFVPNGTLASFPPALV